MRFGVGVLLSLFSASIGAPAVRAQEAAGTQSAQAFFDRFVALGRAYDPAVADLYADDALIQRVRRLPDGTGRTLRSVGADYKRLIRTAMPTARRRGDRDRYSDVSISIEGSRAHIRCTRYNELTRYATSYELVLERANGDWQIVEQYSQSRP
jgi:hypothetical protein